MKNHNNYIKMALKEAKKAWGLTSPNPLVGAIIVKDDKILGTGYHQQAGQPHAEIEALKSCIESPQDAICYITLEPCSTHGLTPPCIQALIDAKLSQIVIGSLDDNPKHQGQAIEILQKHNIKVTVLNDNQCQQLNAPFFHWIKTKKPLVTLKMAMTLDGKIATKSGQSQWITGDKSQQFVQELRKRCDAIMVGGTTVTLDNSSLTVRQKNWQQPKKFIWSSKKFANNLKIMHGDCTHTIKPQTQQQWQQFLMNLGQQNCLNLLLEGGSELAANALQTNSVDEVYFFIAPKILTGRQSRSVIGGPSPLELSQAYNLEEMRLKKIGDDILIQANIKK